jgi:hypothetical protein
LQEYITKPQEANQFLKVTARFDSQGRLQKDSVQFFVEDPGGQYIPLDMNQPCFQSEAELIRQGYEEMRRLAEAVQAPAGKLLIKESTPVYAAPSLDSRPFSMMATASQISASSGRMRELINTVLPRCFKCRMISFISARALGARPEAGISFRTGRHYLILVIR